MVGIARRSRRATWCALFVSSALVAVACGGDDDGDGAAAVPEGGIATGVEEDLGDPVRGGSITVALEAETNSWLPSESQPAASGYNVLYAIFDPLVARAEDGTVQPYLAESIEPNDEVDEWTLRLREGIRFHDGTTLDAELLKRNFDDYLTAPGTVTAGQLDEVVELRVDDERTVTYVLEAPNAAFPDTLTLTPGLPFSVEAAEAAGDDAGSQPVGTGPFVFERWSRDDRLVVKRNPDYWRDGLPYLDEIVFRPIPDEESRAASIRTGDVDAMITLRGSSIKEVMDADGVTAHVRTGNETGATIFNVLEPPVDDVRVRQAFRRAVDQDDVAAVLGDDGLVDHTTQWVSSDSAWWSQRVADAAPPYDPEEAKELIDEYVNDPDRSDGKAVGEPVELTFNCPPDASLVALAEMIQASLQAIDVRVRLNQVEQATHIANAIGGPETDPPFRGDFQANCWRLGDERDPAAALTSAFDDPLTTPTNFTNFSLPELDELLEQLRTTPEFEDRYAVMEEIGLLIHEHAPVGFGVGTATAVAVRDEVKNVTRPTLPDGDPGIGPVQAIARWREVWVEP
jgi:peptide/nickel transport system substrate-binding protein